METEQLLQSDLSRLLFVLDGRKIVHVPKPPSETRLGVYKHLWGFAPPPYEQRRWRMNQLLEGREWCVPEVSFEGLALVAELNYPHRFMAFV